MKKIITAILLLVGFTGSAQWTKPNNSYGTISNGSNVKRALLGPTGCGSPTMLSADSAQKGYGQYFDSCNHVLYLYDPALASWDTVHVGAVAAGGNYLDSFWRVSGIDSNYYRINGVTYAVLDSTGGGVSGWSLTGNSGTTAGTNFIGTTDNVDVVFKRNSIEGMRLQSGALGVTGNINLTATTSSATGVIFKGSNRFIHNFASAGTNGDNTFIGNQSGNFSMTGSSGSLSSYNVGVGAATLLSNTTGSRNTAIGTYALQNNTSGINNTSIGPNASFTNTTGYNNTVGGVRAAAFGNGHDQVGWGVDALSRGNNANYNIGIGTDALYNVWNSQYSVAVGDSTLWVDSTGFYNVAIGARAGYGLGDTYPNYATRHDSLATFLGAYATRDSSISGDVALNNITAIGYNSKVFASNQVVLGNDNVTTTLLKGNVGIGTVNPDSLLDVRGGVKLPNLYSSTNATDSMMVVNSTGGVGYRSIPSGGGGGNISGTAAADQVVVGSGTNTVSSSSALKFNTTTGLIVNETNSVAATFQRNAANTTFTQIDVAQPTGYPPAGDAVSILALGSFYSSTGIYQADGGTIVAGAGMSAGLNIATVHSSAPVKVWTNGNERMRVMPSGYVGIATTSPNSTLTANGSLALKYTASATNINLTDLHQTIELTATDITAYLPTAVGIQGRVYTIKLTASGTASVEAFEGEYIDGIYNYALSAQYKYVTVMSNNVGWIIISNN